MSVETKVFAMRHYMSSLDVSLRCLQQAKFDLLRTRAGDLVMDLRGFLLEQDLEHRTHIFTCEYPDGWVNALRKALGWEYRKRVVREKVEFRVSERYPDSTVQLPEETWGRPVRYSHMDVGSEEEVVDA